MSGITPFLWFDHQAEEAMLFYTSIFPNSKVGTVTRCGEAGPGPAGSVLVVTFELNGLPFMALNGGPEYQFNNAISFMIHCETQEEVDHYWDRLVEGGQPIQCGWLTDKFGLSWQVTPNILNEMLSDPDPAKSQSVMRAMMQMVKLDIAALRHAYDNP